MHTQNAPGWIYSPFPGQVRWSTVLACLGVFVAVLVAGGQPGEAFWLRPLRAVTAAMVALCGFEIAYQAIGAVIHGWSRSNLTLTIAGTGGWLVAAIWLGVRADWRLLALCGVVWVGWIATGYESNMPDRIIPGAAFHWSWMDEAFNVATKTLLALAVLAGTLGWVADRDVHQQRTQLGASRPEAADAHFGLRVGDQLVDGRLQGGDVPRGS